jgi:hypothetical protein
MLWQGFKYVIAINEEICLGLKPYISKPSPCINFHRNIMTSCHIPLEMHEL